MEVIPAIDLRAGKCVRLYQGDYRLETVYSDDPVEVARQWAALGAPRLHVVDLDGARSGSPANLGVVERITGSVEVPVQFGGGVRTVDVAAAVIALGVDRVVVGTAAVESPEVIRAMCERVKPGALVVSVDARDEYVAVEGWTRDSRVLASELVKKIEKMGIERCIYTDISRDGTLTEPNFPAIKSLAAQTRSKLMVAGGISTIGHLVRLSEMNIEAAVVGKALYTGDLDLRESLDAAGDAALHFR